MPWTAASWLLMLWLSPAAAVDATGGGAGRAFSEGDQCVLVAPLAVHVGHGEPGRELPVGTRIRVVRPQNDVTDVLVEGGLATAETAALHKACRARGQAESPQGLSTGDALARAEARFAELRFAEVVPLLRGVIADQTITPEQRKRAYFLQASSYAVMGYTIESETAFRSLLRLDPDFRLERGTSPKMTSVFDRVVREVEALARQEAQAQRKKMLAQLKIAVNDLNDSPGGEALSFDVGIRDPRGVVEQARAFYRRKTEPSFASVALSRAETGRWQADLPAAFTVSDRGFTLEYYLVTLDEQGEVLISAGTEVAPLEAKVLAGALPTTPVYKSIWFWGVVGGATGAAGVVAAGTILVASVYASYSGTVQGIPLYVD